MALPRCSFCNRPKNEVKNLFSIGTVDDTKHLICNRCVGDIGREMDKEQRLTDTGSAKAVEPLRKPIEIKDFLDQHVIAQDSAKRDIAIAVYQHFRRREVGAIADGVEIQKSNIMLLGPSGSGKTEIARTIARMLKIPFYVADATKLTQAGYVGDDVDSVLQGLIQDAGGDVEKAQWGICVIDEIDKLARKSGRGASGYRDVSAEGVQQALLKLVEGGIVSLARGMNAKLISSDIQSVDVIDTSNILFICAGSFAGIEDIVAQRVNKGSRMGFGASETTKKELSRTDVYSQITEDDLLDFGIIPELLGRLPVRTSTVELTEDELIQILTQPKHALVKQKQALFKLDKITLIFDDDALREIARKAKSSVTGARSLRTIVEQVLHSIAYEAPSDPSIVSITVTSETVRGGNPVIIRRPTQGVALG
jgi:ATP-dependent Clp protease ATP-binding subunit ClpX